MKTFPKEDLKAMIWSNHDPDKYELIYDKIEDTSRWSIIHEMVFKDKVENKFYSVSYSEGATECQDESPFEYEPADVECDEVVPKEVVVTKYVKVEETL